MKQRVLVIRGLDESLKAFRSDKEFEERLMDALRVHLAILPEDSFWYRDRGEDGGQQFVVYGVARRARDGILLANGGSTPLYRAPYGTGPDGAFTFGEPERVREVTDFVRFDEVLKGEPIANRPGLELDQLAHRWKRGGEAGKVQGSIGRAHHRRNELAEHLRSQGIDAPHQTAHGVDTEFEHGDGRVGALRVHGYGHLVGTHDLYPDSGDEPEWKHIASARHAQAFLGKVEQPVQHELSDEHQKAHDAGYHAGFSQAAAPDGESRGAAPAKSPHEDGTEMHEHWRSGFQRGAREGSAGPHERPVGFAAKYRPEALKAKARGDSATIDMFGGDATHGGKLHAEKRTDKAGHQTTRYVRAEDEPVTVRSGTEHGGARISPPPTVAASTPAAVPSARDDAAAKAQAHMAKRAEMDAQARERENEPRLGAEGRTPRQMADMHRKAAGGTTDELHATSKAGTRVPQEKWAHAQAAESWSQVRSGEDRDFAWGKSKAAMKSDKIRGVDHLEALHGAGASAKAGDDIAAQHAQQAKIHREAARTTDGRAQVDHDAAADAHESAAAAHADPVKQTLAKDAESRNAFAASRVARESAATRVAGPATEVSPEDRRLIDHAREFHGHDQAETKARARFDAAAKGRSGKWWDEARGLLSKRGTAGHAQAMLERKNKERRHPSPDEDQARTEANHSLFSAADAQHGQSVVSRRVAPHDVDRFGHVLDQLGRGEDPQPPPKTGLKPWIPPPIRH